MGNFNIFDFCFERAILFDDFVTLMIDKKENF